MTAADSIMFPRPMGVVPPGSVSDTAASRSGDVRTLEVASADAPVSDARVPAHPITPDWQPGIYRNVPMDEYHRIDAASNSRLSKLRRSPAHLKAYLAQVQEDTKALRIGRAIHTTILEPDLFDDTFHVAEQCMSVVQKSGERCRNAGLHYYGDLYGWRCGIEAHAKGLPVPSGDHIALPQSDAFACQQIRAAVSGHRAAAKLLGLRRDVELTLVWIDEETGVRCKARIDCVTPEIAGGALLDLKSTEDASEAAFARSLFKWGYYRQAAFYLDAATLLGLPAEHFVIVALEKSAPYAVQAFRLTEGTIDAGRQEIRTLLRRYAQCVERNEWPAYSQDVVDLALPTYAWSQVDDLIQEVA